jgi:hypothetical protein
VIAYKFLKAGGVGLVSGFRWPLPRDGWPGDWVEAAAPVRECESGIHVCRAKDLPYWMHDELWAIEVDGPVVEAVDMVVAPRGRLLGMLEGWSAAGRTTFIQASWDRATRRIREVPADRRRHAVAFMEHMEGYLARNWVQLGTLCSALAIASTEPPGADEKATAKAAYRRERAWQAEWMVGQLRLELPAG